MSTQALVLIVAAAVGVSGAVSASGTQPLALDLKTAAQLAVQTNPNLKSASASADMSRAAIARAKSGLLPTVSAQSDYAYLSKETMFGNTPVLEHNTLMNVVQVQQLLYSGGQVQANVDAARSGYAAASEAASGAKSAVLTNVAAAYFRARQAQDTIAAAESSVKSLEVGYDYAHKLNSAGVVTKSDVLRAEVALASAREGLITTQNSYQVALANLKTAIGIPQNTQIELRDKPEDIAPEAAANLKPRERPEVSASKAILRASQSGKKAAKAGRMPTVALMADYFNEPVGSEFPRRSDSFTVGAMVKLNVFDGGLTRANIDEADAAIHRAEENLNAVNQTAELQLETARLELSSAEARVETTSTQVQSAEESLRTLQAGYRQGLTPITDVLAAETALSAARSSRLAAFYDVKIAQVNLLQALGQTDVLLKQ